MDRASFLLGLCTIPVPTGSSQARPRTEAVTWNSGPGKASSPNAGGSGWDVGGAEHRVGACIMAPPKMPVP